MESEPGDADACKQPDDADGKGDAEGDASTRSGLFPA